MQADIVFAPAEWSPEVEAVMRAASGLSAAYTVEDLREEVLSGGSALRAVVERVDGVPYLLGYLCFWIEPQGAGQELVIHAGAALADERKAMAKVQPHIERLARANDCQSIRAHVDGARRLNLLKANGYAKAEVVMRKWI